MKQSYEIDLKLYCLSQFLEDLRRYNFDIDVEKQIDILRNLVDSKLFKPVPNNYDIVAQKAILVNYLEIPSFINDKKEN